MDKSRGTMVTDATETDATMAQVTILEPASAKGFYGVSMYRWMVLAQDWELLTILKKLMACGCAQPPTPKSIPSSFAFFDVAFCGLLLHQVHFDHLNVERRLSI